MTGAKRPSRRAQAIRPICFWIVLLVIIPVGVGITLMKRRVIGDTWVTRERSRSAS